MCVAFVAVGLMLSIERIFERIKLITVPYSVTSSSGLTLHVRPKQSMHSMIL